MSALAGGARPGARTRITARASAALSRLSFGLGVILFSLSFLGSFCGFNQLDKKGFQNINKLRAKLLLARKRGNWLEGGGWGRFRF
jgi:hypothetical protein